MVVKIDVYLAGSYPTTQERHASSVAPSRHPSVPLEDSGPADRTGEGIREDHQIPTELAASTAPALPPITAGSQKLISLLEHAVVPTVAPSSDPSR